MTINTAWRMHSGPTRPAKASTAQQSTTWISAADEPSQCLLMKGRHASLAGELNWKKVFAPSASRPEKKRLSPSVPRERNAGLLWGVACRATPGRHTHTGDWWMSFIVILTNRHSAHCSCCSFLMTKSFWQKPSPPSCRLALFSPCFLPLLIHQ